MEDNPKSETTEAQNQRSTKTIKDSNQNRPLKTQEFMNPQL